MKKCYTCKINKNDSEFYFDKRINKIHGRCKKCLNQYNIKKYNEYKPLIKQRQQERIKNNSYIKKYYKKCPSCKINLKSSNFYVNKYNIDGLVSYCKKCTGERVKNSEYRKSGKPNLLNAINLFNNKMKLINKMGGKCIKCGESNIIYLQFEHTNNDGNIHRKETNSTSFSAKQLKDIIKNGCKYNLQLMCANCNYEKRLLNDKYFSQLYKEYINAKS